MTKGCSVCAQASPTVKSAWVVPDTLPTASKELQYAVVQTTATNGVLYTQSKACQLEAAFTHAQGLHSPLGAALTPASVALFPVRTDIGLVSYFRPAVGSCCNPSSLALCQLSVVGCLIGGLHLRPVATCFASACTMCHINLEKVIFKLLPSESFY